jgi:tellurite resistance protein
MESQQGSMTPEEIDVFARGLHHLASVDGIDPQEAALIAEFLREAGATITMDDLKGTSFSKFEAVQVFDKTYLRRIFLKTAIALVHHDGRTSLPERLALAELADVFGLTNVEFVELEQEALGAGLA